MYHLHAPSRHVPCLSVHWTTAWSFLCLCGRQLAAGSWTVRPIILFAPVSGAEYTGRWAHVFRDVNKGMSNENSLNRPLIRWQHAGNTLAPNSHKIKREHFGWFSHYLLGFMARSDFEATASFLGSTTGVPSCTPHCTNHENCPAPPHSDDDSDSDEPSAAPCDEHDTETDESEAIDADEFESSEDGGESSKASDDCVLTPQECTDAASGYLERMLDSFSNWESVEPRDIAERVFERLVAARNARVSE